MQTVTIDILNAKAFKFLQDLEQLQLIRLRKDNNDTSQEINWAAKYKGAMTKESLSEIEQQLNELRNNWE